MSNASFTDVVTTTLQGYSGEMADNITNHAALLRVLKEERGNIKPATGRSIVQELEYDENANFAWYSGAEQLNTDLTDSYTAAEFFYKQAAANVVITGLEEIQNSGQEAMFNLAEARIKTAEKTLANRLSEALYAAGTEYDGKTFGGLQLLVAGDPTNTVGGIAGSSVNSLGTAWWKNQVYDFSSPPGGGSAITASSTTITAAMNHMYLKTIRGTDKPDLIVSSETYYTFFEESLQAQQRFASDREAVRGFPNIMYKQTPVVFDPECPATTMYFLNTAYLFLRPAAGRNVKALPDKASVNQDAMVMPIVYAGNMTISNRALQGVIQA